MSESPAVTISAFMTAQGEVSNVVSALKSASASDKLPVSIEQSSGSGLKLTLNAENSDAAVIAVEKLGPILEGFDGLATVDKVEVSGKIPAGLTAGLKSITQSFSLV